MLMLLDIQPRQVGPLCCTALGISFWRQYIEAHGILSGSRVSKTKRDVDTGRRAYLFPRIMTHGCCRRLCRATLNFARFISSVFVCESANNIYATSKDVRLRVLSGSRWLFNKLPNEEFNAHTLAQISINLSTHTHLSVSSTNSRRTSYGSL